MKKKEVLNGVLATNSGATTETPELQMSAWNLCPEPRLEFALGPELGSCAAPTHTRTYTQAQVPSSSPKHRRLCGSAATVG